MQSSEEDADAHAWNALDGIPSILTNATLRLNQDHDLNRWIVCWQTSETDGVIQSMAEHNLPPMTHKTPKRVISCMRITLHASNLQVRILLEERGWSFAPQQQDCGYV